MPAGQTVDAATADGELECRGAHSRGRRVSYRGRRRKIDVQDAITPADRSNRLVCTRKNRLATVWRVLGSDQQGYEDLHATGVLDRRAGLRRMFETQLRRR